jgi:hypothetical protein
MKTRDHHFNVLTWRHVMGLTKVNMTVRWVAGLTDTCCCQMARFLTMTLHHNGMSLHIHRFVDSVKAHEARGQKDFSMPMRDAKDLHADITKLLLTLEQMREQQARGAEIVEVQITGGSFKST